MIFYTKTIKESLEELGSNSNGLSKTEVSDRLSQYGPNLIKVKGIPLWRTIIEPFANTFMIVLMLAAVISFLYGEVIDGWIVFSIMMINAIIFYVQKFSTDRILRSLQKHDPLLVNVLRDNNSVSIDSSEIVPGDIILLDEGDKIPADARLIETNSFRVDETQFTGESLPVDKSIDELGQDKEIYEQTNMIFQGSFVVGGSATALVISTGNSTEFGKLAAISTATSDPSPAQKKIDKLVSKIIKIVAVIGLIVFVLTIYRGIELAEGIRYVLAVSVSAVPEGLPVAITVVLVLGMRRMAKQKALVKAMKAIETVGGLTVIATDKTGTLTKNKLTVQQIWSLDNNNNKLITSLSKSINRSDSKKHDPLDIAISDYVESKKSIDKDHDFVKSFPFDQDYSMSGNLLKDSKDFKLWVKGAPESIISRCNLTKSQHKAFNSMLHSYAANGFRVIALAHTDDINSIDNFSELSSSVEFFFDGLVAIADVLRPEAKKAIEDATKAGVKVCMVTGDHFETAYHIGRQLGIVENESQVFDSRNMSKMSDKELSDKIDNIRIFSRVIPANKHRILAILKQNNITAMTGDGVNDVPALVNAHVGVAMGSGASIAKDAGDIILLDDNFKSIVTAIHEGRTIFANIKRMVAYLLSTNAGEVLISLGALIIGVPIPLLPVQILWVNLVTDTCMVIPLGLEPGEKRNMRRPPQSPNAPLFSRSMIFRIALIAITMAVLTLGIYIIELSNNGHEHARTIAFQAIVVMQWSSAFCFRSDYESIFIRLKKFSLVFYIGLFIAIIMQILVMNTEIGRKLLHITPISGGDIIKYSLIALIVPIVVVEIHKFIGRRFFNKGHAR